MRDWHLGQRGRAAARCDRGGRLRIGQQMPPVECGGSATELSVTDEMPLAER